VKVWQEQHERFAFFRWGNNPNQQFHWWLGNAALAMLHEPREWHLANAIGWGSRV